MELEKNVLVVPAWILTMLQVTLFFYLILLYFIFHLFLIHHTLEQYAALEQEFPATEISILVASTNNNCLDFISSEDDGTDPFASEAVGSEGSGRCNLWDSFDSLPVLEKPIIKVTDAGVVDVDGFLMFDTDGDSALPYSYDANEVYGKEGDTLLPPNFKGTKKSHFKKSKADPPAYDFWSDPDPNWDYKDYVNRVADEIAQKSQSGATDDNNLSLISKAVNPTKPTSLEKLHICITNSHKTNKEEWRILEITDDRQTEIIRKA